MRLQSQPHRLKYPLNAKQVEDLDEMLAILFKQQQLLLTNTPTVVSGSSGIVLVGPPGNDGNDGQDGLSGPPGLAGATGATGANGAAGAAGAQGTPGIDGVDGMEGVMGPPGAIGLTGSTGSTGPAGQPVFGFDGTDGLDGMGIPGPVGPTGVQGIDGATGAAGGLLWFPEAGYDGIDGYPGPMGPQGPAGSSSPWTLVKKTSDEGRSNNAGSGSGVVVADSQLFFAMAANTTYSIRGTIWFSVDNAHLGVSMSTQFTGPASPTLVYGEVRRNATNNAAYNARVFQNVYDTINVNANVYSTALTSAQPGILWFDFMIQNGANAGNFTFSWVAQSAPANSAIVRKGSFIEYLTT